MAKKACRKCKILVEGAKCTICQGTDFSENWKGRVYIIDAEKSEIAKKTGIKQKGEYAIKV
ncbi:MAG TPA: transcription elongation factor subunit Spt4 [Candidatus Nanoarchaeia archaeon]|nr:transcription elongation factor subunit Spt4 [Candidatus Nanoarchaeia archaeon]